MIRMHLGARVPNEGARRLAWWLQARRERFETVARVIGGSVDTVHRLLSGELEPAAEVSFAISNATGGEVVSRDWRSAPHGGWFDQPAPRFYRPRLTGKAA